MRLVQPSPCDSKASEAEAQSLVDQANQQIRRVNAELEEGDTKVYHAELGIGSAVAAATNCTTMSGRFSRR